MPRVCFPIAKLFAGLAAGAVLIALPAWSAASGAAPATLFVFLPIVMNGVSGGPRLGGCPLYPADNIWNVPVDTLPVHARSDSWINSIGRATGFHMDFGSGTWTGGPIGIPYNIVSASQVTHYTLTFYYRRIGSWPLSASRFSAD